MHKIIWFGVDITRVFLRREITRNISCREKFFNTKIRSQVFKANPTYFCHCLLLYFRLNKTGMKFSPNRRKFTDKIASRVLLFTYITNFKKQNGTKLLPWKIWMIFTLTKTSNYKKMYIFLLKQSFSYNLKQERRIPMCAGNWFIFSYQFINKRSKFHRTGGICATQIRNIISSNIKNWNLKD